MQREPVYVNTYMCIPYVWIFWRVWQCRYFSTSMYSQRYLLYQWLTDSYFDFIILFINYLMQNIFILWFNKNLIYSTSHELFKKELLCFFLYIFLMAMPFILYHDLWRCDLGFIQNSKIILVILVLRQRFIMWIHFQLLWDPLCLGWGHNIGWNSSCE